MMFVEAAGGVLVCGGLACVASAVAGRRSWLVASLFAAALLCASVDAFGGSSAWHTVAGALGFAGAVAMVLQRLEKPQALSWEEAAQLSQLIDKLSDGVGNMGVDAWRSGPGPTGKAAP